MASCKRPRHSTRNDMPVAMEWKPINVDTAHTSKALNPTVRAECSSALPSKVSELQEEIARLKLITRKIQKNLETGNNSVLQRDCGEKQSLLRQNRKLRNDLRALTINSIRQKGDYEAAMKLEVDKLSKERKLLISTIQELEKQLQAVKIADEKLTEDCDAEVMSLRDKYQRERRLLTEQNWVLKNDVRTMKVAITRLKKNSEARMKTEVENITKER